MFWCATIGLYTNELSVSMSLRLCSLRWGRVRGREHPLQHGHEQPHLPDVRGSSGLQEQPGTAFSRALLSASLQERLPRLLPANQPSNLPPADKVQKRQHRCSSSVLYIWWSILSLLRSKMKNNEYESVEQIDTDLNLMFENAKRYNVPNSQIYKRVLKLQHILQVI